MDEPFFQWKCDSLSLGIFWVTMGEAIEKPIKGGKARRIFGENAAELRRSPRVEDWPGRIAARESDPSLSLGVGGKSEHP